MEESGQWSGGRQYWYRNKEEDMIFKTVGRKVKEKMKFEHCWKIVNCNGNPNWVRRENCYQEIV